MEGGLSQQLEWACEQLDKIGYDHSGLRRLRDQTHAKLREDGHLPSDERASGGANDGVG